MSQSEITFETLSKLTRKKRLPLWLKQWLQLSSLQKQQFKGMYWAFSLNLSFMFILAALTLTSKKDVGITIDLGDGEPEAEALFSLPSELETAALADLEVVENLDISVPEILIDIPSPNLPSIELLDVGKADEAVSSGETDQSESILDGSGMSVNESKLVAETDRRVAAAGGQLNGPIRVSLSFSGDDDLDLHVIYQSMTRTPAKVRANARSKGLVLPMQSASNYHIFYASRRSDHAALDVDANASSIMSAPCENVIFETVPKSAKYAIYLDNFAERGAFDATPYVIVVKYGKRTKVFEGKLKPTDRMKEIWTFNFSE